MRDYPCQIGADAAEAMDQAQIPSVLWGSQALSLAGCDKISRYDISFVILENLVGSASNVLHDAGFPLCSKPDCKEFREDRHRPVPAIHSHLQPIAEYYNLLTIFTKSSTLWWLPDFTLGTPAQDDPHFMLSNDLRLPPRMVDGGTGPWTELYPIKILNPNTLTDAVIMLSCRDFRQLNGLEYFWRHMLINLASGHANPANNIPKTVRPEFQEFWTNYHNPSVNIWVPLYELQQRMNANNELPPPPPYNVYGPPERARRLLGSPPSRS